MAPERPRGEREKHGGDDAGKDQALVGRHGLGRQPPAELGVPAGDELDVLDEVAVAGQLEADAVAAGGVAAADEPPPLGVGGADQLVVEVDARAGRLRDDLESRGIGRRDRGGRGMGSGGGSAWRRCSAGLRRGPRRARRRTDGAAAASVVGAGRGLRGRGLRRHRRRRRRRDRRRDGGGRGQPRRQLVDLRGQALPVLGRLPREGLRPPERGARGGDVAQGEMRLGQAEVGVVALHDVGPVGDHVAPGLRPLGGRGLEQHDRPRRLALGQRLDAVAVRLVPLLRPAVRGKSTRERREPTPSGRRSIREQ